jgi:endonuclease YncB( thermonuclease family)
MSNAGKTLLFFVFGFFVALYTGLAIAQNPQKLDAQVVRVLDGDTVVVRDIRDGSSHRVRLAQIDAPESDQPFGKESTEALKQLIDGKHVTVTFSRTDQYGRIVGTIWYEDKDVNLYMVSNGYAMRYHRFSDSLEYLQAHREAQRERRGLWGDKNPVNPWDWRRQKGG